MRSLELRVKEFFNLCAGNFLVGVIIINNIIFFRDTESTQTA